MKNSFLIFLFFEMLKFVYCVLGDDTISLEINLDPKQKGFQISKDGVNPQIRAEDYLNDELSIRKKSGQIEKDISKDVKPFNWEGDRSRQFFVKPTEKFAQNIELHSNQPFRESNHRYDWDRKMDDKSESYWNDKKNFEHLSKHELDFKVKWPSGSKMQNQQNEHFLNRNDHHFNIFKTAVHNPDIRKISHHDGHRVDKPRYNHHSIPHTYHNSRPQHDYWNPNFHKQDKGVIINFNSECPVTKHCCQNPEPTKPCQNQLIHKLNFAPQPVLKAQPKIATIQIPQTAFIPTHSISPLCYL